MRARARILATLGLLAIATAPAMVAPQAYMIDGTHTFPRFSYSHFGMSTRLSRFNKTSGNFVLDAENRKGSVNVVIDTRSVDTGYATFDEHIQGEDVLDTARFPTATLTSTAVRFDGDKPVAIDGSLTLKGVTRPVTLTITSFKSMPHPVLKKDAIGANAV